MIEFFGRLGGFWFDVFKEGVFGIGVMLVGLSAVLVAGLLMIGIPALIVFAILWSLGVA